MSYEFLNVQEWLDFYVFQEFQEFQEFLDVLEFLEPYDL